MAENHPITTNPHAVPGATAARRQRLGNGMEGRALTRRCNQVGRVSGLALMMTALVCLFAFSRLAPQTTFVVALGGLAVLVALFWIAGKAEEG